MHVYIIHNTCNTWHIYVQHVLCRSPEFEQESGISIQMLDKKFSSTVTFVSCMYMYTLLYLHVCVYIAAVEWTSGCAGYTGMGLGPLSITSE